MFEMMMLVGIVYAGCSCLLPDRPTSRRSSERDKIRILSSRRVGREKDASLTTIP